MKLKVKLLDSMTKVLPRENLPVTREYCFGSALRGEVFAFQLAFTTDEDRAENIKIELSGPLAAHTRTSGQFEAEYTSFCNWYSAFQAFRA